jgi:N-acetylmuramoyl-L-alanine amidase
MKKYIVRQGDDLQSIAYENCMWWETIWQHPDNAELKRARENPNQLLPGDVVNIPDKQKKEEEVSTEQKHRFKRKGLPAKLRLKILDDNEPRANEPYTLVIEGKTINGNTDQEGCLEVSILPNAKSCKLLLGDDQDEYVFELGSIDPLNETTGIQQRLNNLAFDSGSVDGAFGSQTEAALRGFQEQYGLTANGKLDATTQQKLKQICGC